MPLGNAPGTQLTGYINKYRTEGALKPSPFGAYYLRPWQRPWNWGVKYKHIYWFIFHPIFIPNHTQAVGEIWVYIEFIVDSLPTLRIYESWVKKK